MSYTFLNQQSKLSSLIGDDDSSSDGQYPLATRKKELNRGELQFAKDSMCVKEYASGTVASGEISVPSDWLKTYMLIIDGVVISNDREISISDWERFKDWGGDRPYYYFWEFSGTRKIKLLPSSNTGSYELYYFKRPTTELDDDSDVSLLPEEYREGPVFYAASELLTQIGKTDLADYFRGKYEFIAAKARSESEEHFVNKEYARPDFGEVDEPQTDVQGGMINA